MLLIIILLYCYSSATMVLTKLRTLASNEKRKFFSFIWNKFYYFREKLSAIIRRNHQQNALAIAFVRSLLLWRSGPTKFKKTPWTISSPSLHLPEQTWVYINKDYFPFFSNIDVLIIRATVETVSIVKINIFFITVQKHRIIFSRALQQDAVRSKFMIRWSIK